MHTLAPDALEQHPTTPAVRDQLANIYEDTAYLMAGTLGRTAVMGGVPAYWYRRHGELRDIDVHDPHRLTSADALQKVDGRPLPIDTAGSNWITVQNGDVVLSLPRDPEISVVLPESYIEPIESSLLGVKTRTLRPEILLGLNTAVPYNRISQRPAVDRFRAWVTAQPGFDPKTQKPFEELALRIKEKHPEYIRMLRLKDAASHLPAPVYKAAKSAYKSVRG